MLHGRFYGQEEEYQYNQFKFRQLKNFIELVDGFSMYCSFLSFWVHIDKITLNNQQWRQFMNSKIINYLIPSFMFLQLWIVIHKYWWKQIYFYILFCRTQNPQQIISERGVGVRTEEILSWPWAQLPLWWL